MATRRSPCRRRAARCAAARCATTASGSATLGLVGLERPAAGRGGPPRARRLGPPSRSRSRTTRAAAVSRRRRCSAASSTSPAPVASARLYVTALGAASGVTINGRPVSDDLLAPGWTPYRHRLLADTYDVTRLLTPGRNAIGAVLGDGWYRGRLGWDAADDRCRYGRAARAARPARDRLRRRDAPVVAIGPELAGVDRRDPLRRPVRRQHDRPARGAARLGLRRASTTRGWIAVAIVPFDPGLIEQRSAPPVRRDRRPAGPSRSPRRRGLLAARRRPEHLRLGPAHGPRSRATTASSSATPRCSSPTAPCTPARSAPRRRPTRTSSPTTSRSCSSPRSRSTASATPRSRRRPSSSTRSSSRSAATRRRARHFECSDADLNRLHENVVWSQRDNFVSIPTDCPQRDERLGWTGDAQAFAATGSTLFDSEPRSGRAGCATSSSTRTRPSASRRSCPTSCSPASRASDARAGPTRPRSCRGRSTRRTATRRCSSGSSTSMRALGRFAVATARAGRAARARDAVRRLARPRRPVARPWQAKADSDYLANAFFAHSARLVADAAAVLGDRSAAETYSSLGREMAAATWSRWSDHALDIPDRLRRRAAAGRRARRRAGARRGRAGGARPRSGRARRDRVPGDAARAAGAQRVRAHRRVLPDAPAPRVAVVALPGPPGRRRRSGNAGMRSARTARSTPAR